MVKNINILISLLLFLLVTGVKSQQYFYCDSIVSYSDDSIFVESKCPYYRDISVFPICVADTAGFTRKDGKIINTDLLITYRGNIKTKKGIYRVYRDSILVQESKFYNYLPDGYFYRYVYGYNIPKKCVLKKRYRNGQAHGKSKMYSAKTGKVIVRESYYNGQLIKRIEKYEKW